MINTRMMLKLVAYLLLVALVQPASAVQIRRVMTDSGTVLRLRGNVTDGDYLRLKNVLQNDAVVGLEIRSGGGPAMAPVDGKEICLSPRGRDRDATRFKACCRGSRCESP